MHTQNNGLLVTVVLSVCQEIERRKEWSEKASPRGNGRRNESNPRGIWQAPERERGGNTTGVY